MFCTFLPPQSHSVYQNFPYQHIGLLSIILISPLNPCPIVHFISSLLRDTKLFLNYTFYFEIIIGSHATLRNDSMRSPVPFTFTVSPGGNVLQNYSTVITTGQNWHWYSQDPGHFLYIYHHKDLSCYPFIGISSSLPFSCPPLTSGNH